VLGAVFFILIVFVALSVFVLVFNSFGVYANQVKQQGQQAAQNKETSLSISNFQFGSASGAATVGTSSVGSATQYSFQRKLLYDQGLWWVFYSNGGSIDYRTSGDGSTWSSTSTLVSTSGSGVGYAFSLWQSGNTLYFVLATDNARRANYFTFGSGTLSASGTVSGLSTSTVGTNYVTQDSDSVAVDSSGNIWVAVNTLNGGTYNIEVLENVGGSWSETHLISGVASDTSPIIVPLGSGVALIYGPGGSTGTVYVITTSNNGATWSAAISPPSNYAMFDSSATAIGNTFYFVGLASSSSGQSSGTLNFWGYTFGAGSTSAETKLQTTSNSWQGTISQSNGTLIVFYGQGSTVNQLFSTDLGSSWSPIQIVSSSETSITGLTSAYTSSGAIWTSGTSSFNVRFAALSTATITSRSPFAVHLISLYIYNLVTNAVVHFDTNASAAGVTAKFDYWVGEGQTLAVPLVFPFTPGQSYVITLATDQGVLLSDSFVSPP
jgi:hypothetical protein